VASDAQTKNQDVGEFEVQEELVVVLRAGVTEDSLRKATKLMDSLVLHGIANDPMDFVSAIRAIVDVGQQAGGKRGRALRMMMRLDPETSSSRVTRTEITNRIGQVLDNRKAPTGYSDRRVQQLEKLQLAPYVATQLGLVERIQLELFRDAADSITKPRQLPVFVQYCNPELFRVLGREKVLADRGQMLTLLRMATRMALLLSDNLILFPFSYFYEVPVFPEFMNELGPVKELGLLGYVSPAADLEESRQAKAPEYGLDPNNPYKKKLTVSPGLAWRPRASNTTASDIGTDWESSIDSETGPVFELAKQIAKRLDRSKTGILRDLRAVPSRLDGRAFVGRFAQRALDVEVSPNEVHAIELFLSDTYIKSYLGDLDAIVLVDFPIKSGGMRTPITSSPTFNHRVISVSTLSIGLERMGVGPYLLQHCGWPEFLLARSHALLSLVIDSIAFRPGDPLTERALGELSRFRHPAQRIASIDDLDRVLDTVGRALVQ